jgi:hypothetical protein
MPGSSPGMTDSERLATGRRAGKTVSSRPQRKRVVLIRRTGVVVKLRCRSATASFLKKQRRASRWTIGWLRRADPYLENDEGGQA